MDYINELIAVSIITIFGAMSPGPDFVVVSKNSLIHSRKAGIYAALGVAAGVSIHVAYCLIGIGLIVSQSIIAYSIVKYLGALYLMYLGYKMLKSKAQTPEEIALSSQVAKHKSSWQAFKEGFFTNALNPKATVFFLSVFTQVINVDTPLVIQIGYGILMAIIIGVWFCFLASVLGFGKIKDRFQKVQHHIERALGAVLILLGIKIVVSSNK